MSRKYLVKGLVIIVLFLLAVSGRMIYLQRIHFMTAEKYYSESNWKLAIREYDRAMHFYTPLSPYIEKSAEKLWQIGEMFEKQDKPDWAHIAYSSIRSSFYASRSLYTPGKSWIRKCDDKIADLNVEMLISEGSVNPGEAGAEKKKHLYVMKVDRAPAPFWSLLAEIGFFGWLGSVLFIIFKGFSDDGKIDKRGLLYGLLSFSVTFTLWIGALLKA
jgi:hypothetical protein